MKALKDPPSIQAFLPDYVAKEVNQLPAEFINLDEKDLLDVIRKELNNPNWQPSPLVESLRVNFWAEYEISHRYNIPVTMSKVYEGVCDKGVFEAKTRDSISLAWFCCKPLAYQNEVNALLKQGYRRLHEFLSLPVKDKQGNISEKLVESIAKITAMMDLRIQGGYVQRSEQMIRQQIEHTSGGGAKEVKSQVADIDQRIRELEAKIAATNKQLPPPAIDAELVGLPDGSKA